MTPYEYNEQVLPSILEEWEKKCFCSSPGFQKIVSFNFRDYGIGPAGCADTEILIHTIIREKFTKEGDVAGEYETRQKYRCPQCGALCTEEYADFNINMYRSFAFYEISNKGDEGLYMTGFYGFDMSEVSQIHDFSQTEDIEEYLEYLKG